MNPAALKHEENKKEFEYLQQENERLRNKISQLQNNLDLSTTFDGIVLFFEGPLTKLNHLFDLAAAISVKEFDSLKQQITESNLMNQRLKEIFSKKIKEFRQV